MTTAVSADSAARRCAVKHKHTQVSARAHAKFHLNAKFSFEPQCLPITSENWGFSWIGGWGAGLPRGRGVPGGLGRYFFHHTSSLLRSMAPG